MNMSTNNSLGLIEGCVSMGETDPRAFLSDDVRWETLEKRDSLVCGEFVYGVLTTGVYCRPACASRLPNRENVRFFETSMEAEQAGFRPCKRCKPEAPDWKQPQTRAVLKACRMIAEADEPLSLKELAQAVGLSPFHFQRLFKKIVGVTPKQYAMERRASRLREHLSERLDHNRSDVRCGFRFKQPLLRKGNPNARHETVHLQERRSGCAHPFCRCSMLSWIGIGCRDRARHLRHRLWRYR